MTLLGKLGAPSDWTLCCTWPVLTHVQVTVSPTATVSTAGLAELFCLLRKKSLPIRTAGPPPFPVSGGPSPDPPVGPADDPQPASTSAASNPLNSNPRFRPFRLLFEVVEHACPGTTCACSRTMAHSAQYGRPTAGDPRPPTRSAPLTRSTLRPEAPARLAS